jgi:hypothetical protein
MRNILLRMSQAEGHQGEEAFDRVFSVLVPDAPYLATSKHSRERNAPSPAWFELVVWNVIVAFIINLLASVAFDIGQKWRDARSRGTRGPVTARELEELIERLKTTERLDSKLLHEAIRVLELIRTPESVDGSPVKLADASESTLLGNRTAQPLTAAESAAADILERYGWPQELANRRAKEIAIRIGHGDQSG